MARPEFVVYKHARKPGEWVRFGKRTSVESLKRLAEKLAQEGPVKWVTFIGTTAGRPHFVPKGGNWLGGK